MPMGIGLGIGVTRGGGVGWWPAGSELALEFDNQRGFNSIDRTKTTPDSILTYTNPSAKMVYGSDGVLRYAPHNLLLQSQTFETASWTKGNCTVTANAAVAPDGTTTADALLDTAISDIHRVTQSFTAAAGRTYTVSAYVKKSTLDYATIGITDISSGSLYAVAVFNLAAGTVATSGAEGTGYAVVSSPPPTSVGNGWYRCSVVVVAGTSASFLRAVVSTNKTGVITSASGGSEVYLGNGSGVFVWGAQVSIGSTLFTYIPTTTAAVYSLPIDHNPTTFAPLGVLIEEERKNLLQWSEQFDDAAWTRGNIAAFGSGSVANAIVAPDGTTTADKIVEAATTTTHNMAQNATIVTATVYTYSVYAKAAERSWICLEGGGGGGGFSVWFNLATGAVGTISGTTAGNVSIVALPNGWYRCIVTDTSTSTSGAYRYFICDADNNQSYAGNGTSGLYLWGAQLEAGAFPTSYIPTTNNPLGVTRLADQVSILTSAFGYNAAAGTVAVEAQVPSYVDAPNGNYFFSISDGTQSNLIHIAEINGVRSQIVSGAAVQFDSTVGAEPATDVFIKAAVGYAADDMRLARGGSLGTADTSGTVPSGLTILRIGVRGDANSITYLNGHIKRLTYFPTRRSNADLQVLTT